MLTAADEQGMAVGALVITPIASEPPGITIQLHGDLDATVATELRRVLVDALLRRRLGCILIDLRAVTALDPWVIGTLQAASDMARDIHLPLAFETTGSPVADHLVHQELTPAA